MLVADMLPGQDVGGRYLMPVYPANGNHCKQGCAPSVHDGSPESPDDPDEEVWVGIHGKVIDVLCKWKPCSCCKTVYNGVYCESYFIDFDEDKKQRWLWLPLQWLGLGILSRLWVLPGCCLSIGCWLHMIWLQQRPPQKMIFPTVLWIPVWNCPLQTETLERSGPVWCLLQFP